MPRLYFNDAREARENARTQVNYASRTVRPYSGLIIVIHAAAIFRCHRRNVSGSVSPTVRCITKPRGRVMNRWVDSGERSGPDHYL